MKVCSKCNLEKHEGEFRVIKSSGALRTQCKACEWANRNHSPEARERKRERDRQRAKRADVREYNRNYHKQKRRDALFMVWGDSTSLYKYKVGQFSNISPCECVGCGVKKVLKGDKALWYCMLCRMKGERKKKESICPDCGVQHIAKQSKCRCAECKHKADRAAHKAAEEKRQMIKRGVSTAEGIWRNKVFSLDGWRCRMCKCRVQKKNIYANNAAELDHIIPLSRGGAHTYDNVQTLCRACNQKKSNDIVPTQLRLALMA